MGGQRSALVGNARVVWCALIESYMAEPEDSVPWEVRLLQFYCNSESNLDEVSVCCQIMCCAVRLFNEQIRLGPSWATVICSARGICIIHLYETTMFS